MDSFAVSVLLLIPSFLLSPPHVRALISRTSTAAGGRLSHIMYVFLGEEKKEGGSNACPVSKLAPR